MVNTDKHELSLISIALSIQELSIMTAKCMAANSSVFSSSSTMSKRDDSFSMYEMVVRQLKLESTFGRDNRFVTAVSLPSSTAKCNGNKVD